MADVQKLSLNWIEIDRSIISAISAMQIARGRFDSHSLVTDGLGSQYATMPSSPAGGRHGAHQATARDEQVAICFDDAERMLDEVRARITLARALMSGAPQFDVPARPRFAVSAAFSEGELNQPSIKSLLTRCGRMAFRIVVRGRSAASRSIHNALLFRRKVTSLGISLFHNAKAFAFGCTNQLRRAMGPKSAASNPRSYYEAAAVVFGAAAFSLLASSALAVWMASDAVSGASPSVVPPPAAHIVHDVSAASAAYTGCSVAGWGKACYQRRAQP